VKENPVSDDAITTRLLLPDVHDLDDPSNLTLEIVHPTHTRKPSRRPADVPPAPLRLRYTFPYGVRFASRLADRLRQQGCGAAWRRTCECERGQWTVFDETPVERATKCTLQIHACCPPRPP